MPKTLSNVIPQIETFLDLLTPDHSYNQSQHRSTLQATNPSQASEPNTQISIPSSSASHLHDENAGDFAPDPNMFQVEGSQPGEASDNIPNSRIRNPDAASPSAEYEAQFRTLCNDFNSEKWNEFEEILAKFITFAQEHVGIAHINHDSNK